MCGISGYIGAGSPAVLEQMSAALIHRGPDESGLHVGDNFALAHRRLSVIDLASGQQPMQSPRGYILTYNGEIYNFQELRRELEQSGYTFSTSSDTEVLLNAYQEWGAECLSRLRGMFAFAIWDPERHELFLARDRVGIKPLYYLEHDGCFYFASEIKAFLQIPGYSPRLNRQVLPLYLTFRFTPGAETLFAGVKKLMPGHCMTVSAAKTSEPRCYWKVDFSPENKVDQKNWAEEFWSVFEESTRLRMISDVPLGSYLSGGLDSSLIVAAMSGLSTSPVETFSVGFRDQRFDESPFARQVAEHFSTAHHELRAEEEAADLLDQVIYHLDEPLADLATIPTFLMARETKPHVTVVLSGEGADELLGGYSKYRAFQWLAGLRCVAPKALGRAVASVSGNITLRRLSLAAGAHEAASAYLEMAAVFNRSEMVGLLTPEAAAAGISSDHICESIRPHFAPGRDPLSQLLSLDFHTWLPDDLLLKNDKMTMAHGVEARVPYLDHKLVELCARVPSQYKMRGRQEKILLRSVMQGRLPENICRRKKTGFTVPLEDWMQGPFGRRVDAVLSDETIRKQGLFRPEYIAALKQRPLNHPYYRRQFWSVAALGLWLERFGIEV